MVNKTLQLKRQGGFATVKAAKTAIEAAFAAQKFAVGEPIIGTLTDGSVVLGICGSTTSGSVFYNSSSIDGLIDAVENEIGDLASLNTDTKTSIVAAINALNASNVAYVSGYTDTVVSGATNVDQAIKAIDAAIAGIQAGEAEYSISGTTENLPANIAKRYNLTKTVAGSGQVVGENIDIPKDSALLTAQLGHSGATWDEQAQEIIDGHGDDVLILVYEDKNGDATLVEIPLGDFLKESEFKDGLQVVNNEVSVKLDATAGSDSAKFIYIDGNGAIALSGITSAINTAVSGAVETLDATVGSTTVDTGKHVAVQVVEVNGKLTGVTVTEDDIASNAALTGETAARKAVTGQNGDTYTANTTANYISGATNMNAADIALDTQVKANADAIAALEAAQITIVKGAGSENFLDIQLDGTEYSIVVSGVTAAITSAIKALDTEDSAVANQFVTAVAQADGTLTISRAQAAASGVAATPITGGTFEVNGTTVQAQMAEVVAEISDMQDSAYSGVTAGNGITVTPQDNGDQIAIKIASNNPNNMLTVDSDGLKLSSTFDCGSWS